MALDKKKNRQIHALLSDLRLMSQKPVMVSSITGDRTTHTSEMRNEEANLLIRRLQDMQMDKILPMRKKIIHLLCVYGMTKDDGNGDLDRMNEFVRNIGSRNPKGKDLFHLNIKETLDVLNQIEAMMKKEMAK